ncbi:hypothetical protein GQ457_10G003570 [Hibiscus cannabinus]
MVSRDVIFYEDSYWNWEKNDVQKHDLRSISKELVISKDAENGETSDWFDVAGTTDADEVIKTKSLASVYERCNLVFAEPTSFNDAAKVPEWIDAMMSEISAIEKNGKEHQVYKLKRALYGLKQAPRAWYYIIDSYLQKLGFQRCVNEATLYLKKEKNAYLLVISLYVDDLLVMGSNDKAVSEFKLSMQKEFEMSDLGLMSYFLGMEINQSKADIFISQNKYALDVLKKFKLESCKGVDLPSPSNLKLSKNDGEKLYDPSIFRSIVGSLLYMTATRPDLMFPATLLSRFLSSPIDVHLGVAKRVLKYVKSTLGEGLNYLKMDNVVLTGYFDSDWAVSLDDMKSTSEYVFNLGSGAICGSSKKQQVVAQSTAEAEYIAAAAANQAIWFRNLLYDLGFKQESATVLLCDNKSAIAIADNPIQHGRTKHINVKFHAIRKAEKNSLIKMEFCSFEMQVADLMTKALSRNMMLFLKHELGITNINLEVECLCIESDIEEYLDQLGMASKYDMKTYCRQSLVGGNYGLLNTTNFEPNPDYYRLHRDRKDPLLHSLCKTISKLVISYAIIKASITLLLINLDNSTMVQAKLAFNSTLTLRDIHRSRIWHKIHRTTIIKLPKGITNKITREEYHLTAKDGNLQSQTMLLNGNILSVNSLGIIPPIEATEMSLFSNSV